MKLALKSMIVSATLLASTLSISAHAADIVETAVSAGSFNTLVTAIKAAGLTETLKGKGPFTVFAPTDAAFAKIPKASLDALLADKTKLASVLTYHVVPGKVMAADVKSGAVKSVQGSSIAVNAEGGAVKVDAASVVKADVEASNGVIHAIDTVIMPK
ncbi:MAG: fasciclin domain-containing protein [Burkholderiales bacterium]